MRQLTQQEKDRISDIRKTLRRYKRDGIDVSTWEATFFLRIIDRLTRVK